MCLFEFDQEQAMKSEREEGRAEGRERNMLELVHEGLLDKVVAAEKLGISLEELEKKLKALFDNR